MSELHLENKMRKMGDGKRKIRTLQVPVVRVLKNVKIASNSVSKQKKIHIS